MSKHKSVISNSLAIVVSVGLVALFAGGSALVLTQIVGIVTLNGALTSITMELLGIPIFAIAAITGLLSYIKWYLEGDKSTE